MMKKIIIITCLIFSQITCFAEDPCCICYNRYVENSHAIDVLTVRAISDCFVQTQPFDWYDTAKYGGEIGLTNTPYAPFVDISHDMFTWVSAFSVCADEVMGYKQQIQLQLNEAFSNCVQPYNCQTLVNCGY